MFCAISGEAPEQPVVSKKSGQIYERRLIVKYIEDNGKDPVTGEELTVDDLLDIKSTPGTVKPRPPTMTSIPSILSVLQNEWDSIMLETFTLKQQYQQVRQELSHALYQHDAACRVIARLMKERDAAREALANVQAHLGSKAAAVEEAADVTMAEAGPGLPANVVEKLEETTAVLSKTRKRKPNTTAEAIQTYTQRKVFPGLHAARSPGISAMDLDAKNGRILTGGNDKNALVFSQSEEKVVATLKGHTKKITHVAWNGRDEENDNVLTASADHTVKIWSPSEKGYSCAHTISGHSGEVTGLSVHPTKDFVATTSLDSSWAFHDVQTGGTLMTVQGDDSTAGYTSASFHPDGLLLGTGTGSSAVKIWDVRSREAVATFEGHTGAVKSLAFSENGYLLAAAGEDNQVSVWNLRTLEVVQKLKVADQGVIRSLAWDQSGTYLGVGGTDIRIFKVKSWQELVNLTENTAEITSLKFGPLGDYLVAGGLDRSLRVFGLHGTYIQGTFLTSFQSFLDRFPAPLHPDLFNEPTGYEKALQEVKQYEDFTTIDWVQDAIRERYRQTAKVSEGNNSWMSFLYESYEAGQAWLVVSLVGVVIGVNAAFIAITTEWLSDIKLGRCSYAWWLNQKFCCWGVESEDGYCDLWTPWSGFTLIDYLFYLIFATSFAASAAFLVKRYARYAAGSGISEIKCILAGFIMKGYLGGWTLIIKSLGLAMSVAANLSVGKEGPSIHIACCAGHIVSRLFPKYQRSRAKSREIISASAAAGVAVAFGAPIGGVLFSFEEMSNHFPAKTMWRSFFCALVATVTLQTMNPYRTGKLVMFQVSYDRDWHFFEIIFFIFLGVFGGLYGAFIIKYNLKVQHVRKKYLGDYGVIEAATLAFITCMFAYWNIFMKIDMAESMSILFRECEGSEDYMGLCQPENTWRMVALLFLALVMRLATCTISYGAKVPAGIFVPSMAIGALFGRMVGLIVRAAQVAYPGSMLFSSCKPDVPCITPGTYAFLGAAAALGGVMRLTVCVVVIMFELTGALNYILPTMITLMVTKTVGDYFGRGGIADRYIRLNGYPFLDKEEHSFGIAVSQVMKRSVTVLPASGTRLDHVENLLATTNYQGFPIVDDATSKTLIGYIGRQELRYVIDKAKRSRNVSSTAHCFFRPGNMESRQHMEQQSGMGGMDHTNIRRGSSASGDSDIGIGGTATRRESATNYVDFGPFIDQTPIAVHPKLPLETVMEFFKKMGPRVILVEHQGGLVGLITMKDLLKYITRTEALDEEEGDFELPTERPHRNDRGHDSSRQWWSAMGRGSGSRIGSGLMNGGVSDFDSDPDREEDGYRSQGLSTSSSGCGGKGVDSQHQDPYSTSSNSGVNTSRVGRRSPSVSGMTFASSIGSFRDRIELTENNSAHLLGRSGSTGRGDVLFDHRDYGDVDADDEIEDRDEGEVRLPSADRR
ncbi:glycerol ethanol, ferric requiring protein [Lunasporangiospora selenospora]|uniref:Chloride channel protein n=1 Tax=Lunasporangiospora selenospora TaxID=979761 RepID=A0A9P6FYN2_9FUNG|nr:glycerol ethanol, ferric requiring protein [Lunasporangiospora selenospora]